MKRRIITELDRDMTIAYIKRLELKKCYTIEVKQKRIRRSLSQNSLYWLFLTCIEVETGNNRNDLHEYFKMMFLPADYINIFGQEIPVRTTTDKDTKQFKDYLDKIQIFASSELGIALPDPDDLRWEEFFDYYSDR